MMLWKLAHVSGRNLMTISKAQGPFLRNFVTFAYKADDQTLLRLKSLARLRGPDGRE